MAFTTPIKYSFLYLRATQFPPHWCFGCLKQNLCRAKVDCTVDNVIKSANVNFAQKEMGKVLCLLIIHRVYSLPTLTIYIEKKYPYDCFVVSNIQ